MCPMNWHINRLIDMHFFPFLHIFPYQKMVHAPRRKLLWTKSIFLHHECSIVNTYKLLLPPLLKKHNTSLDCTMCTKAKKNTHTHILLNYKITYQPVTPQCKGQPPISYYVTSPCEPPQQPQ